MLITSPLIVSVWIVTGPNTKEFVFVRMKEQMENVELMEGIEVKLLINEIYFLPYESIK